MAPLEGRRSNLATTRRSRGTTNCTGRHWEVLSTTAGSVQARHCSRRLSSPDCKACSTSATNESLVGAGSASAFSSCERLCESAARRTSRERSSAPAQLAPISQLFRLPAPSASPSAGLFTPPISCGPSISGGSSSANVMTPSPPRPTLPSLGSAASTRPTVSCLCTPAATPPAPVPSPSTAALVSTGRKAGLALDPTANTTSEAPPKQPASSGQCELMSVAVRTELTPEALFLPWCASSSSRQAPLSSNMISSSNTPLPLRPSRALTTPLTGSTYTGAAPAPSSSSSAPSLLSRTSNTSTSLVRVDAAARKRPQGVKATALTPPERAASSFRLRPLPTSSRRTEELQAASTSAFGLTANLSRPFLHLMDCSTAPEATSYCTTQGWSELT
mmetsp:Transcript_31098/g.68566  ORF Transcript_31098/g.68566 Transcript_31098/m.68566 type:complete len:390 (+) Transcript_31098:276-1445(+)